MAHERKADDTDRLEDARSKDREPLAWVAFELGSDMRTFDEYRDYDDDHADERKTGCSGEFVDVTVEGEGVGYEDRAEGYDELATSEKGEEGVCHYTREGESYYLGYCIA